MEQKKHDLEGIGESILNAFVSLREQAIKAELELATENEILLDADHIFEFDKSAFGFVVRVERDGDKAEPQFKLISMCPDIYQMLEGIGQDLDCARQITSSQIFGVFTQGWGVEADDSDDNTPPSQHPKRKRVRLVHLVSMLGDTASAMKIDEMEEAVTEMNSAQGGLSDAIHECVVNAIRQVEASNN